VKLGLIFRKIFCVLAACAGLAAPHFAFAQQNPTDDPPDGYPWEIVVSPYTYHYHYNPEHRYVYLIGLEKRDTGNWSWGAGYFSNSFGQPSCYAFYGYEWRGLFNVPQLYAKLGAGILYGYVKPYENKVPFNHNGFSPLVLPVIGWRLTQRDAVQLIMLGNAGLMFSYNRRF